MIALVWIYLVQSRKGLAGEKIAMQTSAFDENARTQSPHTRLLFIRHDTHSCAHCLNSVVFVIVQKGLIVIRDFVGIQKAFTSVCSLNTGICTPC